MPVTLDPSQAEAALSVIRNPDTDVAAAGAAADARNLRTPPETKPNESMQAMEIIRSKIQRNEELTAQENEILRQANATLAGEKQEEAAPAQPSEHQAKADRIASILAKIDSGEKLTPEEEQYAIAEAEAPAVDTTKYRIGGREFSSDEMVMKLAEDVGSTPEELRVLSPSTLRGMVENLATKLNKQEWTRANASRSQELARDRKQIGVITTRLLQQQEDQRVAMADLQKALEDARALASTNVDVNDIYLDDGSGRIDIMKQRRVNQILDAKENIARLTQQHQQLSERSVQTEKALTVQRFRDFQESFPQYSTTVDIVDAAVRMGDGSLNMDDRDRMIEMMEIMEQADRARVAPDVILERRSKIGNLLIKPVQTSQAGAAAGATRFADDGGNRARELVERLRKKRESYISIGGGGVRPAVKTQGQKAVEVIAASSRAVTSAVNTGDALTKAGY